MDKKLIVTLAIFAALLIGTNASAQTTEKPATPVVATATITMTAEQLQAVIAQAVAAAKPAQALDPCAFDNRKLTDPVGDWDYDPNYKGSSITTTIRRGCDPNNMTAVTREQATPAMLKHQEQLAKLQADVDKARAKAEKSRLDAEFKAEHPCSGFFVDIRCFNGVYGVNGVAYTTVTLPSGRPAGYNNNYGSNSRPAPQPPPMIITAPPRKQ